MGGAMTPIDRVRAVCDGKSVGAVYGRHVGPTTVYPPTPTFVDDVTTVLNDLTEELERSEAVVSIFRGYLDAKDAEIARLRAEWDSLTPADIGMVRVDWFEAKETHCETWRRP